MYVVDGIAYAGTKVKNPKVTGVRPLEDWKLWLRFNNGEVKVYDFKPMLKYPAFERLKDISLFKECYIDFGSVMWLEGDIDIAPEELYMQGIAQTEQTA